MMHYASQGARNALRKGSNVLVHHGGHNGPGGSTTANTTSRSIHLPGPTRSAHGLLHAPLPHTGTTLAQIRPRNPAHKLFSTSKNLLQKFFTHLTAPGLRVPVYLNDLQQSGSRSLHNNALRRTSIQSGLSLPVRNSLRNHALHRQANTFLPRGPGPLAPRCGGVVEVGLGTARNFSTGRPIFQQLAENVPIAARSFYQVDWDIETKKECERLKFMARNGSTPIKKSKSMLKPVNKSQKLVALPLEVKEDSSMEKEMERYFPVAAIEPVTTYLLIPLAPTPTSRVPLQLDPPSTARDPSLLPPLPYLGFLHSSHSAHTLRVSTLFTRLDQANVWSRGGVSCSAYSQGQPHPLPPNLLKDDESDIGEEGVCTILKVEFVGWTKAEVRGIIGESGTGWCVLEEVHNEEDPGYESLSDTDSNSSGLYEDPDKFGDAFEGIDPSGSAIAGMTDPAQRFVLPTLDFSSDFLSSSSSASLPRSPSDEYVFASLPPEMETDPWADDDSSLSSSSSSFSDFSEPIVDPPSVNGWFGADHSFAPGLGFSSQFESRQNEPREGIFY